MSVYWWEIIGLIGLTLVVSTGRIFQPLREWLLGFEKSTNVLRVLGELMSCSMCSGVWVGFLWGLFVERLGMAHSVILGGVISVASLAMNEMLGLLGLGRLAWTRRNQGAMSAAELVQARRQLQGMKANGGARPADLMKETRNRRRENIRALTEDEAEAIADTKEELADTMMLGPVKAR